MFSFEDEALYTLEEPEQQRGHIAQLQDDSIVSGTGELAQVLSAEPIPPSEPPSSRAGSSRAKRQRGHETRYRQDIAGLLAELGAALNLPHESRRAVLQAAIQRVQATPPAAALPVDHRLLFLADATPMAVLNMGGFYLDANEALLSVYGLELTALRGMTIFSKITCATALSEYFAIFQRLSSRRPAGAVLAEAEEELEVRCPWTQASYKANGYVLCQYFKPHFDGDARPAYVSIRLSPRRLYAPVS